MRDLLIERRGDRAAFGSELRLIDAHEEQRGDYLPPDIAQLAHVLLERRRLRACGLCRGACVF